MQTKTCSSTFQSGCHLDLLRDGETWHPVTEPCKAPKLEGAGESLWPLTQAWQKLVNFLAEAPVGEELPPLVGASITSRGKIAGHMKGNQWLLYPL